MLCLCVLVCDDSKVWLPTTFGEMFKFCLCDGKNCTCFIYNIAIEKCLPPNISDFDAIVISGSRLNCRDSCALPWFVELCELIKKAAVSGSPRIYGGCFGCQTIAYALGGVVDYNPKGNFVLKAETVTINTSAFSKFVFPIEKSTFNLIESHGDCVLSLPDSSDLLAYSCSCENEIFVTGKNRNILACQSHPEFDLQYAVYDRIWPSVVVKAKRLSDNEIEEAKQTFSDYTGKDAILLNSFIYSFLCNEPYHKK